MGWVGCSCGNIISDVCDPDPHIGRLQTTYSIDQEREDDYMTVMECNQCGSLLI